MHIIDSCLIIKNEEENIKSLINQLLTFSHEIHITDTGSTDNTLNIIDELQTINSNIFLHYYKWDMNFSNAKNYSLHYDNNISDYQFWCDGDDLLNDELINRLKEFKYSYEEADIFYIKYKYYEDDLNPHFRTSLLKTAANHKWLDPIHEFIELQPDFSLNFDYFNNGSLIIHHRKEVHTNRNLEIFQNMEKTGWKFTARNLFYYGTELAAVGLRESALEMYKKCIYSKDINDITDQINSLKEYAFLKFDEEWIKMFYYLLSNNYYRGDLFYLAGEYYFNVANINELAKIYYLAAINYKYDACISFGLDNFNITVNPLLQLGLIAYNEQKYEEALSYNYKVLEYDQNNETAKNNILFLNNTIHQK